VVAKKQLIVAVLQKKAQGTSNQAPATIPRDKCFVHKELPLENSHHRQ
jgi:hypothetical protein